MIRFDPLAARRAARSFSGAQGALPFSRACTTPLHHLSRAALAVQGALLLSATAWAQEPGHGALPAIQVNAQAAREGPGARTVLTQEELEKSGAASIADVVRYQPLVEAPGTVQGGTRGASRYDRSGTTGYNIRGLEGNRIGLDVDGIEMPDAISRAPQTSRSQDATFGMGRDFIDPSMYSSVEILSGTTNAQRSAGGVGGAVSFRSKSPADYVSLSKPLYLGARLGYQQANRAWTHGATLASQVNDRLGLLLSYVRRDGKQTENNSETVASYPDDWRSDALLLKGSLRMSAAHQMELSADLYRKHSQSKFEAWNTAATAVTGLSTQDARTKRHTLAAAHIWTPTPANAAGGWVDQINTRLYVQDTEMDDSTDTTTLASRALVKEVSQNSTHQWGLSSVADKRLDKHQIKFGLNYSRAHNEHPFKSTDRVGGRQPFPDTRTQRMGVFVEDRIDLEIGGKRLALVPGLRVDRVKPEIRNPAGFGNERITAAELQKMYGDAPANTIVSPNLSLLHEIKPALLAYAQWKRSGRAPTNAEIFGYWNGGGGSYALLGDKNLKRETSNAFDIGLKGQPSEGVQLASSLFYTRYKDFISYTRYTRANNPEKFSNIQRSLNILYQASNRDDATLYGGELSARLDHGTWAPATQGFYSSWAVGYNKGHSVSNYLGDKKIDLDSVQPAKAILGVGYDAAQKQWGINLTGTFVKSKQAQATNRLSFSNNPGDTLAPSTVELFRVPGFSRFDLTGYWRLGKSLRLVAGVYNLGDKKHWAYSNTRSLQPGSAQDRRQIELSTAAGRTYALHMNVDF